MEYVFLCLQTATKQICKEIILQGGKWLFVDTKIRTPWGYEFVYSFNFMFS